MGNCLFGPRQTRSGYLRGQQQSVKEQRFLATVEREVGAGSLINNQRKLAAALSRKNRNADTVVALASEAANQRNQQQHYAQLDRLLSDADRLLDQTVQEAETQTAVQGAAIALARANRVQTGRQLEQSARLFGRQTTHRRQIHDRTVATSSRLQQSTVSQTDQAAIDGEIRAALDIVHGGIALDGEEEEEEDMELKRRFERLHQTRPSS